MTSEERTLLIDTLSDARAYFEEDYRWEKQRIGQGGSEIAAGRWRRYADAIAQAALMLGQSPAETTLPLASHARWLRQVAEEIRREGHNGWGNTCEQAAEAIERTSAPRGPTSVYRDHLENRASSVPGCDCTACESRRFSEKTS